MIKIWRHKDTPENIKKIFIAETGGDEDWVAFIPTEYLEEYGDDLETMLSEGTRFAVCCLYRFSVQGGEVWVGTHS